MEAYINCVPPIFNLYQIHIKSTGNPMQNSKHILVIDWSMVYQQSLYSLLSGSEPITRATDIEEVRYRMAKKIFKVLDLVKPTNVIIAKDNKKPDGSRNYWREGYLARYYSQNTELMHSAEESKTYVRFDNTIFEYTEEMLGTKLTKKNTPKDIKLAEFKLIPELIEKFAPKYKGNRSKTEWVFETSREEFLKMADELSESLTHIVPKCRIVNAELAEADDIAGVLTCKGKGIKHTLLTGDGDWSQLINEDVQVLNPMTLEYLEKTQEEAAFELKVKLVSGDSGDGIRGTYIEGKSGCMGAVKALKVATDNTEEELNQPSFTRNKKLITLDLDTIPKMIQKNIMESLKAAKPSNKLDQTWESVGLPKREQEIIIASSSVLTEKHAPSPFADEIPVYQFPEQGCFEEPPF